MGNEYISVVPSNVSSGQPVGYSSGTPILQFKIGAQDAFLKGNTVRLNGTFTKVGTNKDDAQWEPSLGIYNILEQLVISSDKTTQTIEHIENYNRFLASYIPATSSENDLLGHLNTSSMTTFSELQCLEYTSSVDFSIALPCGVLLGSNPIPLSNQWGLKGLNITLTLAPDSNVFFTTVDGKTAADTTYQLSDLTLTAELSNPAPEQLSKLNSQSSNSFDYNSISSHFAVINNGYATINKNFGIKRCLSVFANFVTSSNINTYDKNGMSTMNIRQRDDSNADITEVIFTRNGQRYPLDYDLISVQRDYPGTTSGDGQILRNYLNALKPFSKLDRTTMNVFNGTNLKSCNKLHDQPPNVYGVGIAYDTISGQGVSLYDVPFSMIIKSTLNTDNPTSCFIYAHSKETIVMNKDGIQVLR
jgi:hypothetical protein